MAGMVFENLTDEELCELMCGKPEQEEEEWEEEPVKQLAETALCKLKPMRFSMDRHKAI